jgi:6-phosphogluconolactonase/glucosamine-6-phosphate isomerase/deaminase
MIIHTFPDTLAAARAAAQRMAALAVEAVQARGRFTVALSGGHSPWRMLEALAALDVPWSAFICSRWTSAWRRRAIPTAMPRTSRRAS